MTKAACPCPAHAERPQSRRKSPKPYRKTHIPKRDACRRKKAAKTTPADNTMQRMVTREAKAEAEGKGVGYDRWAAKYNLKQMAATVYRLSASTAFSSPEELDEACSAAYTAMRKALPS